MDDLNNFVSRQQVRKMTGWSLTFIDRHLPRIKIGGKIFISLAEVSKRLKGYDDSTNPLFVGEGSPMALGMMFQLHAGSPHSFGSSAWDRLGRTLVASFAQHLDENHLNETIRGLAAVEVWMKSADAEAFFDKHIPSEARRAH
ncbi:hypothetical protein FPV16_06910 [Methylobacterium sp. W2]|uniref:hypothetical protein n=1 Tax=Methylobacterium sp. W2 TaxID=2598107 RepID=UPI001D0C9B14|nr:hypothetical protein [Methylobacterium sp. W2]MCC0805955.1 hypothetical protein [Methylobacterium sp. W2]